MPCARRLLGLKRTPPRWWTGRKKLLQTGETNMNVLVVTGKAFSGADAFAKALADRLGYPLVDAAVVIERAAARGRTHRELREALEPPRAMDRFLRRRQRNLILLQSALAEEIACDGAVCYGDLGELLPVLGDCLRIRIEAPRDFRIVAVCDRLKLRRNEAIRYLQRQDRNRERWLRDANGWNTPARADMVLDLERLTVQEACEIAIRLVHCRSVPGVPTGAGRSALDDFALCCRVRSALSMAPQTAALDLGVAAEAGVVRLSGMIRSPEQLTEIQEVMWGVPGIAGIFLNGERGLHPAVASHKLTPERSGARGFPRWKPLQHAWSAIGLALGLTIVGSWSLSQFGARVTASLLPRESARTFVGIITDTTCGPKPDMDAQCVRACVRTGAKYALYDGRGLYNLSNQEVGDRYAAQRVRIRGTLDESARDVKVESIQPIS